MIYSYHRLWLLSLVLVVVLNIIAFKVCNCLNNDANSATNTPHQDSGLGNIEAVEAVATAGLKDVADASSDLGITDDTGDLWHSLLFQPSELDFGIGSVGTIHSHVVTLINQNRNRSVYLSSVTGKTSAFYSSFFEAKMIPPKGNTTFNVVFLPRIEGTINTSLNIHTSFGQLQLLVKGEGRECPYRLKPLVGIRAPLNATLMPEIHMYNPHEKPLQILEVYSSGGQFQLELPSGDPEAPQGLWQIPPFTTKPVIRIRFQGLTAGNYSAFIRIKIADPHSKAEDNHDELPPLSSTTTDDFIKEQILVIPVEFEILKEYGIYAVNPLLEFGFVAINNDSNLKNNNLKKSTKFPLKQNLYLKHSKSQLEEQFDQLKFVSLTPILKGVTMASEDNMISTLLLQPEDVTEPVTQINEKLQLILKDPSANHHNIDLIIRANIFKGSLNYDVNSTIFLLDPNVTTKGDDLFEKEEEVIEMENTLLLRNDFLIPLFIYNVTTTNTLINNNNNTNNSSSGSVILLNVKAIENEIILQPGQTWSLVINLKISKHQKDHSLNDDLWRNYKTAICIYTNVTNYEIPIVISSKRLFVTAQTETQWHSINSNYTKELQLNTILNAKSQKGYIIFQNRNTLPIKVTNWKLEAEENISKNLYYSLMSRGCIRASEVKKNVTIDLENNYEIGNVLQQGDVAIFVLNITPYVSDIKKVNFKIETTYENISITVRFNTAAGVLEVDEEKLHFADCFPGKLCSSDLSIRSSFKHSLKIKYINLTLPGLSLEDINPRRIEILPQTVTHIGRLYFEPSALCQDNCYISQNVNAAGVFLSNQVYHHGAPPFDNISLRARINAYSNFKYYLQNIDLILATKEKEIFHLNLSIDLHWPQLVKGPQTLSTTEIKKSKVYEVKITNPSDQPILVDYKLENPMYAKTTLIYLPTEVLLSRPGCYLTDKEVFSLVSQAPKNPILIPGMSSIKVPIQFQSNEIGRYCTILHVRNNLTLYEGIWLSAKAVQSQFRLGNRKPGSPTPLLFEITEQQLALACPREEGFKEDRVEQRVLLPQIVTRRTFTARNSGELPIMIEQFLIDDQPCKGYGFEIMNCSNFILQSNSSMTIEIVFQSDFTVTRMSNSLVVKTNLTYPINYTLVAQLPSKGLDQCNALLVRPLWEKEIRNISLVMLAITCALVLFAARIDYNNIMFQSSLYRREKGQVHPTFNLRNIAMGATMTTTSTTTQNNNEEFNDGYKEKGGGGGGGVRKRVVNKQQPQKQQQPQTPNGSDLMANGLESYNSHSNSISFAKMLDMTSKYLKYSKNKEKLEPKNVGNGITKVKQSTQTIKKNKISEKIDQKQEEENKRTTTLKERKKKKRKQEELEIDPLSLIKGSIDDFPKWRFTPYNPDEQQMPNGNDVLTPWTYGSRCISFRDGIQENAPTNQSSSMAHLTNSPRSESTNSENYFKTFQDFVSFIGDEDADPQQKTKSLSENCIKNFEEFVTFVGEPARPSPTELGPIGSRKSPSSSPKLESKLSSVSPSFTNNKNNNNSNNNNNNNNNNSDIAMQLQKPLVINTIENATSSPIAINNYNNVHQQQQQQKQNLIYPKQQKQEQGQKQISQPFHPHPQAQSHMTNFNYHPDVPMSNNYPGYQTQMPSLPTSVEQQQQQKQHDINITAKLLKIQAHEEFVRSRYMEQYLMYQQQQQYLNYLQSLNVTDWSTATQLLQHQQQQQQQHHHHHHPHSHHNNLGLGSSSSTWSPLGGDGMANISSNLFAANDLVSSAPAAWRSMITPPSPSHIESSSTGVNILDHNSPFHYNMNNNNNINSSGDPVANKVNRNNFSPAVTAPSSRKSNNNTNNITNGHLGSSNNINKELKINHSNNTEEGSSDNMPTFNLFGGLSPIWNDNWKQAVAVSKSLEGSSENGQINYNEKDKNQGNEKPASTKKEE